MNLQTLSVTELNTQEMRTIDGGRRIPWGQLWSEFKKYAGSVGTALSYVPGSVWDAMNNSYTETTPSP